MRTMLGCALSALFFSFGLSADDKKDETIDAKKLIGKWEPKNEKEGHVVAIEFKDAGKAAVTATNRGKVGTFDGTYKVTGSKLVVTITVEGEEIVRTHTISKLTDTALVWADVSETVGTLVRIKNK